MIRAFLKNQLLKNKALFFQEGQRISGFLYLLMKQRNTGEKWTAEERVEIKKQLKILAMYIPILLIFLLPGGSILLPFLAEVMDRRKVSRRPQAQASPPAISPDSRIPEQTKGLGQN
jgi:hypothetical protein